MAASFVLSSEASSTYPSWVKSPSRRARSWAGENYYASELLDTGRLTDSAACANLMLVIPRITHPAAALAERCVLTHRGWVGENGGHFEHPTGGLAQISVKRERKNNSSDELLIWRSDELLTFNK